MDPSAASDTRAGDAANIGTGAGGMVPSAVGGMGLGAAPGDNAFSTTTVSTGMDPSTGVATTTFATYTVGAVPAASDDSPAAGYATYTTYTATTVGVPADLAAAGAGGGGGVRVTELSMEDDDDDDAEDIGEGDVEYDTPLPDTADTMGMGTGMGMGMGAMSAGGAAGERVGGRIKPPMVE